MEFKETAFKELDLNIKHQGINKNEFMQIGYQYDEGQFVFMLIFPKFHKTPKK